MMQILAMILSVALATATAEETQIRVDAGRVIHQVSPFLHGACIEDVNHEIYGGLYSQMIFGESFQEPPRAVPLKGFTSFGGRWVVHDGIVDASPGDGPKLMLDESAASATEVGVEIKFPTAQSGNAGMILRVDKPGVGADTFTGYEVSLETDGFLVLGRHRRNWEPLQRVECVVPVDRWIKLWVSLVGNKLEIMVDGRSKLIYEDKEHPLASGSLGLRDWQRPASFRNLWVKSGGVTREHIFESRDPEAAGQAISGMWGPVKTGSTRGEFSIVEREPFVGRQAQRMGFVGGAGTVGIENRGLNRWGMNIIASKPYEGSIWARSEAPTRLTLGFESGDGTRRLGESTIEVKSSGWAKYDFAITPTGSDPKGRFTIWLDQPGAVTLGYVFLQPGDWGRFKGLPVRRDVAEGLIDQGITVLRYGGSMVNHPQYRWKSMIGPRDRRPTNPGTWYAYSTNGWGILDFLNFCEAAGFLAIPDLNVNETPQDLVDFVEYVNGSAESPWGRKRVLDGHPEPYRLKQIQLGNEEAVNDDYWKKFEPIANAIWAKDKEITLVIGDFAYGKVIDNPDRFEGGVVVNSLSAHRKILELARARNREVWFDIHISTNQPPEPNGLKPERSYIDQLGKLAPGAKFKVVIFEYNSGNHRMKRALSNALATIEVERIGNVVPIACVANCLQPDGQNDNGWDQGMLFLNPDKVWLQPPGYLVQMANRNFQPNLVATEIRGQSDRLSVNARRSDDGKTLVLEVVNWDDRSREVGLDFQGFVPKLPVAKVDQMAGPLEAANTADAPNLITPNRFEWRHEITSGRMTTVLPAHSITFLHFD